MLKNLALLSLLLAGGLAQVITISPPQVTRLSDEEFRTVFDAINNNCVLLQPATSGYLIEGEGFGPCDRPSSCGCVQYTCEDETVCRNRDDLKKCNSTDGTESCLDFGQCVTQRLNNITFTLVPRTGATNESCNFNFILAPLRAQLNRICRGTTCRILLSTGGFNDNGELIINARASDECLKRIREHALLNVTGGPSCGTWVTTSVSGPSNDSFSDNILFLNDVDSGYLGSSIEGLFFNNFFNLNLTDGMVLFVVPKRENVQLDVCNIRARVVEGGPVNDSFKGQDAIRVPTRFATYGDLYDNSILTSILPEELLQRFTPFNIESFIRETCQDVRAAPMTETSAFASKPIDVDAINFDSSSTSTTSASTTSASSTETTTSIGVARGGGGIYAAVAAEGDNTTNSDYLAVCRAKWNPSSDGVCPINPNCPTKSCYYCGSVETCVRPSFQQRDVCNVVTDVFAGVDISEACCDHDMCFTVAENKDDIQRCNIVFSNNAFLLCLKQRCGSNETGDNPICETLCRSLSTAAYAVLAASAELELFGEKNLGTQGEYDGLCNCTINGGTTSLPPDQWVSISPSNPDQYELDANCTLLNCDTGFVACNGTCVNGTCCEGFRTCRNAGPNLNQTICIPDNLCCINERTCPDTNTNTTDGSGTNSTTNNPAICVGNDECCPGFHRCDFGGIIDGCDFGAGNFTNFTAICFPDDVCCPNEKACIINTNNGTTNGTDNNNGTTTVCVPQAACCPGLRLCPATDANSNNTCVPETECCSFERTCANTTTNETFCQSKDTCCPGQRSCSISDAVYCTNQCCITEKICGDGSCVNITDCCPEETRICGDGRCVDPNTTCCFGEFRNANGVCVVFEQCASDCSRPRACLNADNGNVTCALRSECCANETPCGIFGTTCCAQGERCNELGQCERV